jgi:predicted 3-demethylubiquinone-9 3-methyltransferase (glyoxalase superfamily)
MQNIMPFLWFDNQAEEAVTFYTSIFKNATIKSVIRYGAEGGDVTGQQPRKVMTISFQIEGQEFAAINGGPVFKITPVISFFVSCDTLQEIDTLWGKLSEDGTVMMELDKYPFSEKYGWIQDKFGVSWQLILPGRKQKIAPCLMFAGEQHKKAEEAINFYISVFKDSHIIQLERYEAGVGPEGAVVHSKFTLNGEEFVAMDSHIELPYNFNPAISFVVNCKTQEEVDYYWDILSEGGDESAQQCGWLKDRFGISWQIIPTEMLKMLSDSDLKKSGHVMQAMLQMKKIDLNVLKKAYLHD